MTYAKRRIVVIVKTYPNLSRKYVETVCVAGLADGGKWIRIFPVRFRQLPFWRKFKKFDIIEAEVEPDLDKYSRVESHNVKDTTINIIGHLPTKEDNWQKRKELLLSHLDKSIETLEVERDSKHKSLGIIKPKEIIDFYKKRTDEIRDWERDLIQGTQLTLGGEKYTSPLDKIPYWIGYKFKCDDETCKGHNMMCEDWELLELFRVMKEKYKDDEIAFGKVKDKYFNWMIEKRDPYFIVGTESRWNNFIIISVFYPPK
jgi:hypothetical protein